MSAVSPGLRGRVTRALPGIAFAALVAAAYADPLFLRRNFTGRDLAIYNLPMEKAVHEAWERGKFPVWSPHVSGGRPLLPNPNAGALYPPRALLAPLPFPTAMRLFPVLHWIAAGVGMILLLRGLGASTAGSWVGAVTYVFSGVAVAESFFPNLHPGMALLPWILWAVRRPARSSSGRVLLLSFLFGLICLAGDVFTIGMGVVSAVLWISVETARRDRLRTLASLAASLLLAGLLAAPQILATALWVPDTHRAVVGMKLFESLYFSVHPLRLIELAVPFPFGANWTLEDAHVWGWPVFRGKAMGMFTSLYAGAFALVALVESRRARGEGFRFGRILFLLALAVSVLPSLTPRAWEKLASPLPLRNPEKFSVALVLALAILSGLTFDRLRRESPRWPLAVGVLLGVLAAASALFPSAAGRAGTWLAGAGSERIPVASKEIPAALAEGALLWIATVVAVEGLRRDSRPALAVSLALLTAVPLAANRKIARTFPEEEIFAPTPFARFLSRADPGGRYRTVGESLYRPPSPLAIALADSAGAHPEAQRRSWIQYLPSLWRRGTVFNHDFDSGDFARMESLRRLSATAAGLPDSGRFFGSFALRWGIRFRDQEPISAYRPFGGDRLQSWDELGEALPDVRLSSAWVESKGSAESLAAVAGLDPGEIVIETGRSGRGASRGGLTRVLRDDPERLIVETVTPDASWLFVLRGFWDHRTVLLDGRPVDSIPAQVAFSAVPVPAGRHTIDWREEVPGGGASRWGPGLYALVAVLLASRSRLQGRGRVA